MKTKADSERWTSLIDSLRKRLHHPVGAQLFDGSAESPHPRQHEMVGGGNRFGRAHEARGTSGAHGGVHDRRHVGATRVYDHHVENVGAHRSEHSLGAWNVFTVA